MRMYSRLVWAVAALVTSTACLDPTGSGDFRLPPGLISPVSDGCPSTPIPLLSCLEPGAYKLGVEPPVYRTSAAGLPLGDRNAWDDLEAGTYGVSMPVGDGSNIVWYVGRDTALTRIGIATTTDYTTWTKLAVSAAPAAANVVSTPNNGCDAGGFVGGFG